MYKAMQPYRVLGGYVQYRMCHQLWISLQNHERLSVGIAWQVNNYINIYIYICIYVYNVGIVDETWI